MQSRTLRLRSEHVTELSTNELEQVAGATAAEVMHTLGECFTCQTSIDVHKCAS